MENEEPTLLQSAQALAAQNEDNREFIKAELYFLCSGMGSTDDIKAFVEKKGPFATNVLSRCVDLCKQEKNCRAIQYLLSINSTLTYNIRNIVYNQPDEQEALNLLIYVVENNRCEDINDINEVVDLACYRGYLKLAAYLLTHYQKHITASTFLLYLQWLPLEEKSAFIKRQK